MFERCVARFLIAMSCLAVGSSALAADPKADLWAKLKPFFTPPDQYRDDFGPYRSPLLFADGTKVQSASDWQRRRQEIFNEWHKMLGPWPELLKQPKVKVLATEHRENFTQERVEIEISPDGNVTTAHLLVPYGKGPFPAVLVTFYDSATSVGLGKSGRDTHDFGLQLARRGFVTLSISTPSSTQKEGRDTRDLLTKAGEERDRQPLTFLAYVAANCHTVLAQRKDVDPKRIGVVGLSYGGKWAMFASCLYDKFACACWSDPGIVFNEKNANVNYWEPWYLGYEKGTRRKAGVPNADRPRTGLYKRLFEEKRDLNDLHALICPRPVLVSGGTEDPPENWRALNHLVAVNKLLGHENRVGLTSRKTHIPDAPALAQTVQFFEYFLK